MISVVPLPWELLEDVFGMVSKGSVTRLTGKEVTEHYQPLKPEHQLLEVTSGSGEDCFPSMTVPLKLLEKEKMPGTPSLPGFSPVVPWPSEVVGDTLEIRPLHVHVSWVFSKGLV